MRWLLVLQGFVRRELRSTLSQPLLLVVLVLGPFAILLLFGGGYRNETISLDTVFVAPDNEQLREEIIRNQETFEDYIVPVGFTDDLFEAQQRLRGGEIDVVVVFPPNPERSIEAGEQVEIAVLHDKIDPIQIAAVDIAAEVAVQQINASVVIEIVELGQAELDAEGERFEELLALSDRLREATADRSPEEIAEVSERLDRNLASAALAANTTARLIDVLGDDVETTEERARLTELENEIDRASMSLAEVRNDPLAAGAPQKALELNQTIQSLADPLSQLRTVPAEVLVRPFSHDAESVVGRSIGPVDFFVPSAIALLIQHAALTFSALTIVRDRDLGLVEQYRVGSAPVSAILLGKSLAFVLIGGVLAALLIALVGAALGVGVAGSLAAVALVLALLLSASTSLGLVLSLLSRSDTQAVQYAMLALLASIFFGGFFLSLDALRYPFKGVAWALPVTYAIRGLQDVMLRGDAPARVDLLGLTALTVVCGLLAWWLLRRETRPV
jgi:ABC-2 type transport system permease protein